MRTGFQPHDNDVTPEVYFNLSKTFCFSKIAGPCLTQAKKHYECSVMKTSVVSHHPMCWSTELHFILILILINLKFRVAFIYEYPSHPLPETLQKLMFVWLVLYEGCGVLVFLLTF